MKNPSKVGFAETIEVRDNCLCMHAQYGARALARIFDAAFSDLDVTHGQFSLLMSLNRPAPAKLSSIAVLLGMDRTSLTAKLKALHRRKLIEISIDTSDRRNRLLTLTGAGRTLLSHAYPIWKVTHARVNTFVAKVDQKKLIQQMLTLGRAS